MRPLRCDELSADDILQSLWQLRAELHRALGQGQAALRLARHGATTDIAPYAYGHIELAEGVFVQAIITGVEIDPDNLKSCFEAGPVDVAPDIQEVQGLSILAYKRV